MARNGWRNPQCERKAAAPHRTSQLVAVWRDRLATSSKAEREEKGTMNEEAVFDVFVGDPAQLNLDLHLYKLWLQGLPGQHQSCSFFVSFLDTAVCSRPLHFFFFFFFFGFQISLCI